MPLVSRRLSKRELVVRHKDGFMTIQKAKPGLKAPKPKSKPKAEKPKPKA